MQRRSAPAGSARGRACPGLGQATRGVARVRRASVRIVLSVAISAHLGELRNRLVPPALPTLADLSLGGELGMLSANMGMLLEQC